MTVSLWIVCLIVLTAMTIVFCALALGSDADDTADALLERLEKEKHEHTRSFFN